MPKYIYTLSTTDKDTLEHSKEGITLPDVPIESPTKIDVTTPAMLNDEEKKALDQVMASRGLQFLNVEP